jgi:hypothetical protein
VVTGDVTATNSEDFTLNDSVVLGNVLIRGGRNARVASNEIGEVESGNLSELVVLENENAVVFLNIATDLIKVNKNGRAIVAGNAAPTINCKNNGRLEARQNESEGGDCGEFD